MEKEIRDRYSKSILLQAVHTYGIGEDTLRELDGFESFIYEFQRNEMPGILRISHSIRRPPEMIKAELDWIDHLHLHGVGVSQPLTSIHGNWVESIEDGKGGFFLAAAFEKAPGEPHRGPDWPEELLWEYGNQIGRMHQLATSYRPSNPAWKRPDWNDSIHHEVVEFIPKKEKGIRRLYHETVQQIAALPKEKTGFGLIHQDAHRGNFFVDQEGKITFFDFDDSSYSWFVEDIALVLFYAVMGQEDPAGFTDQFLRGFLPGYFAANDLEEKWFKEVPLFMKMRELDLYAVIHRSFDVDNLDDPWCIWYLDGRADRLLADKPYLDFDFEGLNYSAFR